MRRVSLVVGSLVLALLMPVAASAQTTNCTTYAWSGGRWYDTTCTSSNSYSSALVDLYVQEAALRQQAAYFQALQDQQREYLAQQQALYEVQVRQARLTAWAGKGVAVGSFIKGADGLAIYTLDSDGRLRTFQSWGQFLRHGGHADLSNVLIFNTVSVLTSDFFGPPLTD